MKQPPTPQEPETKYHDPPLCSKSPIFYPKIITIKKSPDHSQDNKCYSMLILVLR
ncbi:hypothetical protein HanPI659440_Chr08g0300191 [Helianthus annuus]|nr:hypothetical protein HanPI659440_Chr08g0300191 [Helianthus annuus]